MTSTDISQRRKRLFRHLVLWEFRRLALPLGGWLALSLCAAAFIHAADWSLPDYGQTAAREIREERQALADAGLWLGMAAVVYLTGELFLPLRPGVARSRFALPPRRQDALGAAFLIQAVVIIPFVFYYKGWVMARYWHENDDQFFSQFLPPVPAIAASLAFIAMIAGDWGLYLLISACSALGVIWFDSDHWPRQLPVSAVILIVVLSVAGALKVLQWHRRWIVMAVWALGLLLLIRL